MITDKAQAKVLQTLQQSVRQHQLKSFLLHEKQQKTQRFDVNQF
jgi:hypothetical protein